MSWTLHRIDDRLIHGQVVVAWGQRLHPQRIEVVDDAVAANAWECELLSGSAPGIVVSVHSVADAARAYGDEAGRAGGAFLLVRDLATALRLVEAGADVHAFTLGGLHYAPGKAKINEYVYLDEEDRRVARALLARGIALLVQDVPATRPQPLITLDPASQPA